MIIKTHRRYSCNSEWRVIYFAEVGDAQRVTVFTGEMILLGGVLVGKGELVVVLRQGMTF